MCVCVCVCCNGISQNPSQSYSKHGIIPALVLGIVPCLSYCISFAIKPFLYSMNMMTVPFHSSITLSDCISFKNTTIYIYINKFMQINDFKYCYLT